MNIEIKDGQVYLDRTVETQSSINEVRQRLSSIRHRVHNRLLWLGYYKHGQAGKRGSISKRRMNKAPHCPKCKKGHLHETIIAGLPLSFWCDRCEYRESDPNE